MVEAIRKETIPFVMGYSVAGYQVPRVDQQLPQQMAVACDRTPPKVVVKLPPGPLREVAFLSKEIPRQDSPDFTKPS